MDWYDSDMYGWQNATSLNTEMAEAWIDCTSLSQMRDIHTIRIIIPVLRHIACGAHDQPLIRIHLYESHFQIVQNAKMRNDASWKVTVVELLPK